MPNKRPKISDLSFVNVMPIDLRNKSLWYIVFQTSILSIIINNKFKVYAVREIVFNYPLE